VLMLAFEASAKSASTALWRDGALLGQYFQNCGLTHSVTLLPMAEALLKNSGVTLSQVDTLAVSFGPGSFTGIRIGVSTVKGLAWAESKPCVGVSTLEAMAWNGLGAGEGSLICCAMDARRSQVYNALFRIREGKPERLCADRAISLAELTEELRNMPEEKIFVTGDGAHIAFEALRQAELQCVLAPEPLRYQTAWGVCMAAQDKPAIPASELLPFYLRLSQAERERQERLEAQNK